MIYITFRHTRDLFTGNIFQKWVYNSFDFTINDIEKPFKFEGCEYGNNYPKISMSFLIFEKSKNKIPLSFLKKVTKIQGVFSVIEQLVLGVCNFENDCENGGLLNGTVSSSVYDFRKKQQNN